MLFQSLKKPTSKPNQLQLFHFASTSSFSSFGLMLQTSQ